MQYAPREPDRQLLDIIVRLAHANRSDQCIVSGDKLKELLFAWYHKRRSIRWIWYHLFALRREHLIVRQTRWRALGGRLVLKARSRYRLAWRLMTRQIYAAKSALKLMTHVEPGPRRQTVQKFAVGLEDLLRSVLPACG